MEVDGLGEEVASDHRLGVRIGIAQPDLRTYRENELPDTLFAQHSIKKTLQMYEISTEISIYNKKVIFYYSRHVDIFDSTYVSQKLILYVHNAILIDTLYSNIKNNTSH